MLDLAVAMTAAPVEVPSTLRNALRQHVTEAQLVELAATIARSFSQAIVLLLVLGEPVAERRPRGYGARR